MNVSGVVPDQVPSVVVSVEPTFAVPEMTGGVRSFGATLLAACPLWAEPKTEPIASATSASGSASSQRRRPRVMCVI